MITFETTKKFKKEVANLGKRIKNKLFERLRLFSEDTNHHLLKVHPLKGNLVGLYSFSVTGDMIIHFKWQYKERTEVLLISISSHSKLY